MKCTIKSNTTQPFIRFSNIKEDGWYEPIDSHFDIRLLFLKGMPMIALIVSAKVVEPVMSGHCWSEYSFRKVDIVVEI